MQTLKTNVCKYKQTMSLFKERFQYLMDRKKISQAEFVAQTGINKSTVSLWLNGKITPGVKNLHILSDFFKCSYEWLAEGKGDPFPTYITAENSTEYFLPRQERKEANKTLDKILLEKFKMQCGSVYFDEFFEFIAENYGTSKEDVDDFLSELMKTHSNYRVWLEEKKQAGEDLHTGGQKRITANGE